MDGTRTLPEEGKSPIYEEGFRPDPLAVALERASAAGQWDIVATLAAELQARRLEVAGNVVPLKRRTR